MYTAVFLSLLGATALAKPLAPRQAPSSTSSSSAAAPTSTGSTAPLTDVEILNFALTAEHLEAAYYQQGLQKFDANAFTAAGVSAGFRDNLAEIGKDEASHVTFLQSAIASAGGTAVQPCTYNFPLTDVKSFVSVSSVLEGIGASAYLGAAPAVNSKAILSAAASIMSVEARHSSFVRAVLNEVPNAQSLDTPLSPNEVFSLASAFIASCPSSNPPLPFKAFPALTTTNTGTLAAGATVNVATTAQISGNDKAAFLALAGPMFMPIQQVSGGFTTTVPQGLSGQTYMVVTNTQVANITDANVLAGPLVLEIR